MRLLVDHRDVEHRVGIPALRGEGADGAVLPAHPFSPGAHCGVLGAGGGGVGEDVHPPAAVSGVLVTQVLAVGVRDPVDRVGLEALAQGEAASQLLVGVLPHQQPGLVLGHETGRELGGLGVEVLQGRGALQLLGLGGHHRGPLAVEVDQVLGDLLALGGVGGQQRLRGQAGEHVTQLPGDVEAVLDGHVHALAGLGRVGVAGVAGDEHARGAGAGLLGGDVVEPVGDAVSDLVDAPPAHVLHVHRVRRDDLVGLADDGLQRGLADGTVVVLIHLTQIHVHAEQEPALTGDVQDGAVLGLDGALGADVREVGLGDHVHHTPGVVGHGTDVLRADGLADA